MAHPFTAASPLPPLNGGQVRWMIAIWNFVCACDHGDCFWYYHGVTIPVINCGECFASNERDQEREVGEAAGSPLYFRLDLWMWCLSADLGVQHCRLLTRTQAGKTLPGSCQRTLPLLSYHCLHFLMPLSSGPPAVIKSKNQTAQANFGQEETKQKQNVHSGGSIYI